MKILIGILITKLPNKEAEKRFKENIKRIANDLIELEWNEEKRRKIINEQLSHSNKHE